MKNYVTSWAVGFLFAIGLGISGMTQPQKIVGFLDVFGQWDPSLIFVMIGAVMVHFVSFRIIRKRKSPMYSQQWHLPQKTKLTKNLFVGSFIFGVGWGLGGYCPGPAVVSLAALDWRPIYFVASMLVGMLVFKLLDRKFKFNR